MSVTEAISKAIHSMALVGNDDAKQALMEKAQSYTLDQWRATTIRKLAAVGGLTGAAGGPIGLALEGLDITYLLAAAGRACYGVGHIKGREIDYDSDITMILAIWCGAAEAVGTVGVGKVGIKVAGKAGLNVAANVAGKVAGKMAAKSAMKLGGKTGMAVVGMASTHFAAKIASKMSVKWIPVVGGLVGAGINVWIINGLLNAADQYYSNDFVVLGDNLATELV